MIALSLMTYVVDLDSYKLHMIGVHCTQKCICVLMLMTI